MAISEVSICNLAIARVGGESISSLAENVKAAKLCTIFYSNSRDSVLAEMWWTFATKRQTLARLATAPESEFGYAYQLPSDLITPRYLADAEDVEYVIEGDTLVTDAEEVDLVYTFQQADTTKFTPLFTDCVAFRVAAELALPLTNRPTNQSNFTQLYQKALSRAKVTDQDRGSKKRPTGSRWLNSRIGNSTNSGLPKKLSNE